MSCNKHDHMQQTLQHHRSAPSPKLPAPPPPVLHPLMALARSCSCLQAKGPHACTTTPKKASSCARHGAQVGRQVASGA